MSMLCCVTFHPLCELTGYSVVGTALGPTLTMGLTAIGRSVSQALFSPGHQHRSAEVRFYNCSNHGSGHTADTMRQLRLSSGPSPVCMFP